MNYKILADYWYTPTSPGADPATHVMMNLPNLAVIFVAIETGQGLWKCYMGWFPITDANASERIKGQQLIAQNGAKVEKVVACAHFPNLDPEKFTY